MKRFLSKLDDVQVFAYATVFTVVLFAGVHMACNKARAESPRALVATSCVDTAGTYVPTIISATNAVASMNPAHFMQLCNEVYVSGVMAISVNSIDTALNSLVKISLPVASDLTTPPLSASGQCLVFQFGAAQPVAGFVGILTPFAPPSGVVINWRANHKGAYTVVYSFSYTIK